MIEKSKNNKLRTNQQNNNEPYKNRTLIDESDYKV